MTKNNWALLVPALILGLLTARAGAEEVGLVKHNRVNVRGHASLSAEVISQLKKGETVAVLEEITVQKPKPGEPAKWLKIAMPPATPVWVNVEFIDAATKSVKPKKLNVRSGPGENFSVVARLPKGTAVHELRTVNNWMEIEAPNHSFAYVAANLIARQADKVEVAKNDEKLDLKPEPVPLPEPITDKPGNPTTPPAPVNPAPAAAKVPTPAAAPAIQAPPRKRVVTREGRVRRSMSIQAPSDFVLEALDNKNTINYLRSPSPDLKLKLYNGFRVLVSGEEVIDSRWPKTPILQIESIDLP